MSRRAAMDKAPRAKPGWPQFAFGVHVLTASGTTATSYSTFTGTGGLTLGGQGTLTLNCTGNYTGTTNVNGGTLSVGNPLALANGTGTVALNGGTVQAPYAMTIANPFTLSSSNVTINGSSNLTFSGAGTLTNPVAPSTFPLAAAFGNTLNVTGNIMFGLGSGAGVLNEGGGSFTAGSVYVMSGNSLNFGANDAVSYLQLNGSSATTAATGNVTANVDVTTGSTLNV